MLFKAEAKVMDYLFEKCRGKKTVLLTPKEILQAILPKYELTAKQLDAIMKNLALDGYIDVQNSDKQGSLVYVVTLKLKGEAYERERQEAKKKIVRSIAFKIGLGIVTFIITFALGRLLGRW
ncbi:MAG: hypothetical protein FWE38_01535 [Firmicutes bacterium]|nr:hypothetical protein [Bacillota bacterium]